MNLVTDVYASAAAHVSPELVRGGPEAIDSVAGEWRALCEAAPRDEPFNRPDWIRAYLEAFAPGARVVVATVREGGRLIAALPLVRELGVMSGLPARRLRSAANTHSCRFELAHDGSRREVALEALWRALMLEPGWDVLELTDVPADGALTALARLAAASGHPVHHSPTLTPPYLDLARAAGIGEVLARTDAKFRANLRRRMRRLQERGAVTLSRRETVAAGLDEFFALERRGWKGAQSSAIASAAATRAFYEDIARSAERAGTLSLYALELDGRAIAMYFGLHDRGRFYLLKTAYDESFGDCSPGQLLTHEALRDLLARGCVELDFLGGMMDWKRDWSPAVRELYDVHIFRGSAGRALHALRFRLRPAAARMLRGMRAAR